MNVNVEEKKTSEMKRLCKNSPKLKIKRKIISHFFSKNNYTERDNYFYAICSDHTIWRIRCYYGCQLDGEWEYCMTMYFPEIPQEVI